MKFNGFLEKMWLCRKHSTKGFALTKTIMEFVIAALLIVTVCRLAVYFTQLSNHEEIKLESVMLNISAVEVIKQMLYSGSSIEDIVLFSNEKEDYLTEVFSVYEVQGLSDPMLHGDESETISDSFVLYRVVVTTAHRGQAINGTELVTYILAKKS